LGIRLVRAHCNSLINSSIYQSYYRSDSKSMLHRTLEFQGFNKWIPRDIWLWMQIKRQFSSKNMNMKASFLPSNPSSCSSWAKSNFSIFFLILNECLKEAVSNLLLASFASYTGQWTTRSSHNVLLSISCQHLPLFFISFSIWISNLSFKFIL
jgi:hypothetical protein